MKKLAVILLAILIIGTMPAFAAEYSGITVDTMAVRGRGVASASQITEVVRKHTTGIDNKTFGTNANVSRQNQLQNNDSVTSTFWKNKDWG